MPTSGRNKDNPEFVPEFDLADKPSSVSDEVIAGTSAAAEILDNEDFSDWEKKSQHD
jgi:hypothetical protein